MAVPVDFTRAELEPVVALGRAHHGDDLGAVCAFAVGLEGGQLGRGAGWHGIAGARLRAHVRLAGFQ